jgi:hypothetical protein
MPKTPKYQIENAHIEQASGGPDVAILVADVQLKPTEGNPFYLTLVECEGMPMVYRTESTLLDLWLEPNAHEDELDDLVDNVAIYDGENYDELLKNNKNIECYQGLRYLVHIMRDLDWDEAEAYIQATKGKNLDEIV